MFSQHCQSFLLPSQTLVEGSSIVEGFYIGRHENRELGTWIYSYVLPTDAVYGNFLVYLAFYLLNSMW